MLCLTMRPSRMKHLLERVSSYPVRLFAVVVVHWASLVKGR